MATFLLHLSEKNALGLLRYWEGSVSVMAAFPCSPEPRRSANQIVGLMCLSPLSFQSLLDEPNPNSPANSLAAQLYQENRREYEKKVKVVVEESWMNNWYLL